MERQTTEKWTLAFGPSVGVAVVLDRNDVIGVDVEGAARRGVVLELHELARAARLIELGRDLIGAQTAIKM